MLVPLWLKRLKEGALSPEKLVHVGTTVAEMIKGRQVRKIWLMLVPLWLKWTQEGAAVRPDNCLAV